MPARVPAGACGAQGRAALTTPSPRAACRAPALAPAAITPKGRDIIEWVNKGSSRIWRGSYGTSDWKHLGRGAWEPRERKGRGARAPGRPRPRKQTPAGSHKRQQGGGRASNRGEALREVLGLRQSAPPRLLCRPVTG
jgi:hypothetical protein